MPIASLARAVRHLLVAVVVGGMAIALNISGAAIVYQGPLAIFLDRAIALAFIGGIVMGIASALLFSYRGTICQPQTVISGVLSIAAASAAARLGDPTSERGFATVAGLVVATTTLTGATCWLLGRLRLGLAARFIPFPVLTGFLAATGYLLIVGGLGMVLGQPVRLGNLGRLIDPGNPLRWAPWLGAALAITVLTRRLGEPIVFPVGLLVAAAAFYAVIAFAGSGIDGAAEAGLLLGPFGVDGLLPALLSWRPLSLDGPTVLAQAPSIAAAVGLAVVGTVLGASSLEIAVGHRIDPDRDLRAVGIANLAAAVAPPGYHAMAQTLLAHDLGATGRSTGWIVAVASALALTVGTPVVAVLPIGVFATGVIVVGLNLLVGPLIDQRRSMPAVDYLIVLIIPVVTAVFGFLWGVATGLLAAGLFFVVTFARIDVVRLATTLARLRSRLERPDAEQVRLAVLGRAVAIYRLEGYIFFGTADRLVQRVEAALGGASPPRYVVIDFGRVRGLDTSAARSLARLGEACRDRGVMLCLAGLDEAGQTAVRSQVLDPAGTATSFAPRLDQALEQLEEALLAPDAAAAAGPSGFLDALRRRHPSADVEGYFEPVSVPAGAEVITQGAASDNLLVLRSGTLRTEVSVDGAAPVTVARCVPGALVGEIGLYTGAPRTARVVAERPSEFLRIDAGALERMGRDDPALLADFHRTVAATLARRLRRTTALLADAEVLAR